MKVDPDAEQTEEGFEQMDAGQEWKDGGRPVRLKQEETEGLLLVQVMSGAESIRVIGTEEI